MRCKENGIYYAIIFESDLGEEQKFLFDAPEEYRKDIIAMREKDGWKYVRTLTTDKKSLWLQQKLDHSFNLRARYEKNLKNAQLKLARGEYDTVSEFRDEVIVINNRLTTLYVRIIRLMKELLGEHNIYPRKDYLSSLGITLLDLKCPDGRII